MAVLDKVIGLEVQTDPHIWRPRLRLVAPLGDEVGGRRGPKLLYLTIVRAPMAPYPMPINQWARNVSTEATPRPRLVALPRLDVEGLGR